MAHSTVAYLVGPGNHSGLLSFVVISLRNVGSYFIAPRIPPALLVDVCVCASLCVKWPEHTKEEEEGRREKEGGRRKKAGGRKRKEEEGRRKKEEGRKKERGRR